MVDKSDSSHIHDVHGVRHLKMLAEIEHKVLWLSTWMIHHANHLRAKPDDLPVGGHQASSASVATLMTALYFDVLRPQDRVAVKPHASPIYHAIQYLLGRQSLEQLERYRALGGAQAYPSRVGDIDDVDFSTGSVGLGVAMTAFSSLAQDYLYDHGWLPEEKSKARMIALLGDAELDEGNVFEAMFEGWKHDLRNVWWLIDYNRQSLDSFVEDHLFGRIAQLFRTLDWEVEVLKYGKQLEQAFQKPGGDALRRWIDNCPNGLYSALVFRGGAAWREQLQKDLGTTSGIPALLDEQSDESLQALMTNLGGHDMESILETLHAISDDRPRCLVAYTVKGYRLPFAGHKDNHAGILTPAQMRIFQQTMQIAEGEEWEPFSGLRVPRAEIEEFLATVPLASLPPRRYRPPSWPIPRDLELPSLKKTSTQATFGRLLGALADRDDEFAKRVVTASPDVSMSTNLSDWINKRAIYSRRPQRDTFSDPRIETPRQWTWTRRGQHIELGIAESNLFTLLASLGLAGPLFGERVFPIGTVYDPFIRRGLDALNYACYQDARFLLVGTRSGISSSYEGGAHQSLESPLLGIGQAGLTAFDPAFADEVREILLWSFECMQSDNGSSVYLRLTTRPIDQPCRQMTPELREAILRGGYWFVEPGSDARTSIIACGAVVSEAIQALHDVHQRDPDAGLLIVTSPDRLHAEWRQAKQPGTGVQAETSHAEQLLASLPTGATLLTVVDGHPLTLSWLGSVVGHRVTPLGIDRFGQSGDLPELYRAYGIAREEISSRLLLGRQASPQADHLLSSLGQAVPH